jgi:hypothetical protein
MNLVALAHRQGRRRTSRFKCRFLGGVFPIDIAIVQHAPLIANWNDRVLSPYLISNYFLAGSLLGRTVLLLSGIRSRP